jgi:hypothetical protein
MLYLYRGGNVPKAEDFFIKATTKRPNRQTQELLKTYRPKDKLDEVKRGREEEAEIIKDVAERLYNDKQAGALENFQALRYRYGNTLVYTNNKTAIDTKITILTSGGK